MPLVDPTDVGAPVLSATVLSQPMQTLDSLRAARHGTLDSEGIDLSDSVELPLMEVRALLDLGDVAKATRKLDDDGDGDHAGGRAAANYVLASATATTTANITAATLTPAVTAASKVYDGRRVRRSRSCTLTGVVGGDVVTCSAARRASTRAGVGTGKTVTARA